MAPVTQLTSKWRVTNQSKTVSFLTGTKVMLQMKTGKKMTCAIHPELASFRNIAVKVF